MIATFCDEIREQTAVLLFAIRSASRTLGFLFNGLFCPDLCRPPACVRNYVSEWKRHGPLPALCSSDGATTTARCKVGSDTAMVGDGYTLYEEWTAKMGDCRRCFNPMSG